MTQKILRITVELLERQRLDKKRKEQNSAINTGYMVFLTKVKTEQKGAEIIMPSEMNGSYTQIRATDLSALLFKGKETIYQYLIVFRVDFTPTFPQSQMLNKKGQICMTVASTHNGASQFQLI